ncbi:MAG: ribosome assembly RNA-binding protein YhbY [Usitatibacter sp.]
MPLNSSRRSELRAEAHKLSPVVIIGDKGLTDEVVAEIDRSLKAHELIKVRAMTADRDARGTWMQAICEKLSAEAVQQIGKVLVLYRANPKEKEVQAPREAKREPRESKRLQREPRESKRLQREPREAKRLQREPRGKPTIRKSRVAQAASETKRTARPRSRTPSAPRESEPRRRRPRSSR